MHAGADRRTFPHVHRNATIKPVKPPSALHPSLQPPLWLLRRILLLTLPLSAACTTPQRPAQEPPADPLAALVALVNAEPARRTESANGVAFDSIHAVQDGPCHVEVRTHSDLPIPGDMAVASVIRVPVGLLDVPATYRYNDLAWPGYFVTAPTLTRRAELRERLTMRGGTRLERQTQQVRLTFREIESAERAIALLGLVTHACRTPVGTPQ